MSVFTRGERVRIIEPETKSDVYVVKSVKKYRKGGTLYLLKLLDVNPILRLYYETDKSLLERIC